MDYSSVSVAGKREHNEDSSIAVPIGKGILLAVADGLGGHAAGEIASNIAVTRLRTVFQDGYREGMAEDEIKELLILAFKEADSAVCENAVGDRKGMGTTLVAAFVENGTVVCANTGDSRLYLYSSTLRQITVDHSLVQDLVNRGLIERKSARFHPMKNIINHSLGGDFNVDTFCFNAQEGDAILLSSDGLHDYLDEDVIESAFDIKSANGIAKTLIKEAFATSDDNITAVVLRF
ncbi:MAG: serine/threonine-protein phosphatase [Methanomicrobium sp.]|nr:serine/threonine-protein phosphatase [Methanomicrobium sp.]